MDGHKFYKLFLGIALLIPAQSHAMWRSIIGQRLAQTTFRTPATLGFLQSWCQPASRNFSNARLSNFLASSAFSPNKQFQPLCVTPLNAQKLFQQQPFFANTTNATTQANWRPMLAFGIPLVGYFFKTEEEKQQQEAITKLIIHLRKDELDKAKEIFNQLVLQIDQETLLQKLFPDRINMYSTTDSKFLEQIIDQSNQAAETLTQLAVKDFDTLIESNGGLNFLEKLTKNPQAATTLTTLIINNFSIIVESSAGWNFLKNLTNNHQIAPALTIFATNNFSTIIKSREGREFLKELIKNNAQAATALTILAINNFSTTESYKGRNFLEELLQQAIITNKETVISIAQEETEKHLREPRSHNPLKLIILCKLLGATISDNQTPTEKHLWINTNKALNNNNNIAIIESYFSNENLQHMLQQIKHHEMQFNHAESEYITFFHGQKSKYTITEEWFTKLWSLKNNKPIKDFLFAHVKPIQLTQANQNNMLRTQIINQGRTTYETREQLLFMNYAFFGNITSLGSCTAFYILCNGNIINPDINLKTAFDLNGYKTIYDQFEKELKALEHEYHKLCKHGSLLLIAIPKKNLAQCVYLAKVGGYKKSITIDGQKTDDINLIMQTLKNNPEKISDSDKLEFCLVMTQDEHGGLNPDSGIKIIPIRAVDPELWEAFEKKQQALFAKIEAAIKKQEQQKQNGKTN